MWSHFIFYLKKLEFHFENNSKYYKKYFKELIIQHFALKLHYNSAIGKLYNKNFILVTKSNLPKHISTLYHFRIV